MAYVWCRICLDKRTTGRCTVCGVVGLGGLESDECPVDGGELEVIPCPGCVFVVGGGSAS